MSQVRRLSLVLTFFCSLMIFLVAWPPPYLAQAQESVTQASPPGGFTRDLVWLLFMCAAAWAATEFVRGLSKKHLAPKPSTFLSRLVTRSAALGFGLLLGHWEVTPTFGLDVPAAHVAAGAVAGFGAVLLHPFFNWALKALRQVLKATTKRVFGRLAAETEASAAEEPSDG